MFYSIVTRLCSHPHYLIPEPFFIILRKIPTSCQSSFFIPEPRANKNPLSVSVDLTTLDVSYKCHHTTCGLLCLATFIYHKTFEVYPWCNMDHYNVSFWSWKIFYHLAHHTLLFHANHGYWAHFHLLAIMNNAAINFMYRFLCGHVFNSLECTPSSAIPGSYGNCTFTLWGPAKLFFKVVTSFYISTTNVWLLIFPHPCWYLLLSVFYCSHPSKYEVVSHKVLIVTSPMTNNVGHFLNVITGHLHSFFE